ncbi:MAG: hypothetical protein U0694_22995 [Anaerolineae bacterium]
MILQSLFYGVFYGSGATTSNFPPALEVGLVYLRDLLISLNPDFNGFEYTGHVD